MAPNAPVRFVDGEKVEDWISANSKALLGWDDPARGKGPGRNPGYTVYILNTWDSPEADHLWTEICGKERWRNMPDRLAEQIACVSDEQCRFTTEDSDGDGADDILVYEPDALTTCSEQGICELPGAPFGGSCDDESPCDWPFICAQPSSFGGMPESPAQTMRGMSTAGPCTGHPPSSPR